MALLQTLSIERNPFTVLQDRGLGRVVEPAVGLVWGADEGVTDFAGQDFLLRMSRMREFTVS